MSIRKLNKKAYFIALNEAWQNHSEWLSKKASSTLYHIQTGWLFICNDIQSMIIPTMTFAVSSALVEPLFKSPTPEAFEFAASFLAAALWSCINLFLFCLHNQRQPASIEEDRWNKCWRPIPSNRITREQIMSLFRIGYPISLAFSLYFGGLVESVALGFLTLWYNEWGGANTCLVRNLLNAGGVVFYYSGALNVLTKTSGRNFDSQNINLFIWLGIIGAIIFTTIHLQDLRDQEGDGKRSRKTIPLVYGDLACRVSVMVALGLWSVLVPFFWQVSLVGYSISMGLGALLMYRIVAIRTAKGDDRTFKLWSVWMMALLLMPTIANLK